MKIFLNRRAVFYSLLALLMLMIFFKYSFSVNIPQIVLTAIILVVAFIGDQNEILSISVCCLPLHNLVDFYLIIGICAIVYSVKYFKLIKPGNAIILGLFMVLWEFLHSFIDDFNIKTTFGTLITLVFLIIVISSNISTIDYNFIVKSLSIVSICICITLLVGCVVDSGLDFKLAMANLQRLGAITEDDVSLINPNTIGIINIIIVSMLIQTPIVDGIAKKHIPIFIQCFLLLVFGMLTASRTFLVLFVILLLMTIIALPGNIQKKIWYFLGMVVLFIAFILVFKLLFPQNFQFFLSRFKVDVWNGRDSILTDYNKYMISNLWVLLFGVGLSDFKHKVIDVFEISLSVPHNGIQEAVVAWGIIGFVFFVLLIITMVNESFKYEGRKNILNFMPLILILSKSMVGQLLTSNYTILALLIAYLSLCQNYSKTKDITTLSHN